MNVWTRLLTSGKNSEPKVVLARIYKKTKDGVPPFDSALNWVTFQIVGSPLKCDLLKSGQIHSSHWGRVTITNSEELKFSFPVTIFAARPWVFSVYGSCFCKVLECAQGWLEICTWTAGVSLSFLGQCAGFEGLEPLWSWNLHSSETVTRRVNVHWMK